MQYVVHPGIGKTAPNTSDVLIDAGTLASLYGLSPGGYLLNNDFSPAYIHLFPNEIGIYRNILVELHDDGNDYFYDYPAFMHRSRDGRYKYSHAIQPQYEPTFRDRRGRNKDRVL